MADATALQGYPQFKAFTAQDLAWLGKAVEERSFKAGKEVFRQDEEEDVTSVFFIKAGNVTLLKSIDGKERVLGSLSAGEFFGESSLISPAPHSLTARAGADLTLLVLDQHGYEQLQKEAPITAFRLLDLFLAGLVARLREADARLVEKFEKPPAVETGGGAS